MTKKGPAMLYTRFYDQVLTEISAGKVNNGINLLVGMLDTVDIGPGSLAQAKRELSGHSLARMLLEDPSVADAEARPNDISARIGMIGRAVPGSEVSSTGRRLFEVTSELTFARALRQRRESFEQRFTRGWQLGQKICVLISGGADAASQMSNADYSKATVVDADDAERGLRLAEYSAQRFDLILAPDLFDRTVEPELSNILKIAAASLNSNGSIIVAALLPHHLGAGWRSACLNWNPHCHDEAALVQIAAKAGLHARSYRDETDCILWGELGVHHGN
jgi:hypothetical protein